LIQEIQNLLDRLKYLSDYYDENLRAINDIVGQDIKNHSIIVHWEDIDHFLKKKEGVSKDITVVSRELDERLKSNISVLESLPSFTNKINSELQHISVSISMCDHYYKSINTQKNTLYSSN
jgi:RNAse (barnase) inhibitor barstar